MRIMALTSFGKVFIFFFQSIFCQVRKCWIDIFKIADLLNEMIVNCAFNCGSADHNTALAE